MEVTDGIRDQILKRLRVPLAEAAELLGMHTDVLRKEAVRFGFTVLTNKGERGRARRMFFKPAELVAFADGGEPGLAAYKAGLEAERRRGAKRKPR